MIKIMAKTTIDTDNCQGCELCTVACPKNIVVMDEKLNKKGFYNDESETTGNVNSKGAWR